MPPAGESMIPSLAQNWHNLLLSAFFLSIAIAIALVTHSVVFRLLRRSAERKGAVLNSSLVRHGEKPARWVFALLTGLAVSPALPLPPTLMAALEHITGLGLIAAVARLATLFIDIASDVLASRYRIDIAYTLHARR